MHDPDGSTPKPASTCGNTARATLHNVYYRTPAFPCLALCRSVSAALAWTWWGGAERIIARTATRP